MIIIIDKLIKVNFILFLLIEKYKVLVIVVYYWSAVTRDIYLWYDYYCKTFVHFLLMKLIQCLMKLTKKKID